MRNAFAMCGKELRVFFGTWTSYVLLASFMLISAFFFQRLVIEYQFRTMQYMQMRDEATLASMNLTDWVMAPLLMNITVFFLFMLPMVTMRLFAEERRQKTLALLLTCPTRPTELVIGKFLAGTVLMGLMLLSTALFPYLLDVFGRSAGAPSPLDWQTVGTGYLGMFLLGSAFVAVGTFTSSLSESQIVSVLLGFASLLLFYVIGLAARGQEGAWQDVLQYLSINSHLESFLRGIVRLSDVVYYLSVVFLGLFFCQRVIDAERWR